MLKKASPRALLCLSALLLTAGPIPSAAARAQKKELSAEEVRMRVESFGVGLEARVRIRLKNGTKLEGFIERAGEDSFYLIRTSGRYSTAVIVAYGDVARIEAKKSFFDWRRVAYRTGMGAGVVLSFLRRLRMSGPAIAPRFPR
jgi:hypothetical protein